MFEIIIILLLFFITSCSETSFIINSAKILGDSKYGDRPNYKVGKPYKINGQWFYPAVDYQYDEVGIASWYGPNFHGKKTANGEIFNQNAVSAAHKTLPIPSIVIVTNLENNKKLEIRINDRGPFVRGRIIDLSKKAAEKLDIIKTGTAKVRVQILEHESRAVALEGLDFQKTKYVTPAKTEKIVKKSLDENTNLSPRKNKNEIISTNKLIIQVGAFNNSDNANKLLNKLTGFKAFIKKEFIKNNLFYRVRIGPFNNIDNAKNVLRKLLLKGFNTSKILYSYENN